MMRAAQFRGRGLLAAKEGTPVNGRLLTVQGDDDQVVSVERFDTLVEWHHEHQPEAVNLKSDNEQGKIALQWCEIASALHQPMKVDVSCTKD